MGHVHIDQKGLARAANDAGIVTEAANKIAERVRGMGIGVGDEDGGPHEVPLPVVVRTSTNDGLTTASVVLAHPAGSAVQAKHGALTKAAAAAGLTVRGG